jgi:hypothetical protein
VHSIAVADIILWRRKQVSASNIGVATAAWSLLDVVDYFLTLACYAAMIANTSAFLNLYLHPISSVLQLCFRI